MFLDARGRTVGYGGGDREVVHVAGCKGAARGLEVALTYPEPPVLFVRDLSSFEVVRSVELPLGRGKRFRGLSVDALQCLSEDGARSVVLATNYGEPRAKSALLSIDGEDVEVIHEGTARGAAFTDDVAYLQSGRWGRRLTRVSLRTGAERFDTTLPPRFSSELALSPNGAKLAGISYPPYDRMDEEPSLLYVVDLGDGAVRKRSLGTGERDAHVLWLSGRRLAMFVAYPDASRVFDLRLRTQARFGRWDSRSTAIVGATAFGVDYGGRLLEVGLPDGSPAVARRLPSPVVYDLAEVR